MKLLRIGVATLAIFFAAACNNEQPLEPPAGDGVGSSRPELQTQMWCETHPVECNGGYPTDPNTEAAGYFFGTTVTPAACFSSGGAGINDIDLDGMSDYCENVLASAFSPLLISSPYDCDMGMEPYFAVKHFPADPNNPQGGEGTTVRIFYALSYYEDCGNPSGSNVGCTAIQLVGTLVSFNGLYLPVVTKNLCDAHLGDSEFITVDVTYDIDTQHWSTTSMYTSAHWKTGNDRSARTIARSIQWGDKTGGYPRVYVALYKHGNYKSVAACENGTLTSPGDNCQGNYVETRVRASSLYNIGSKQHNFINTGSCVTGGLLVRYYPEMYRTECFWTSDRFAGWDLYGPGVTPYRTELMLQFECMSYVYDPALVKYTCTNFGVNRTGVPIA